MSAILSNPSKQLLNHTILPSPTNRLAQARRHLSAISAPKSRVRDVYVIGAARTPTGKVCLLRYIPILILL